MKKKALEALEQLSKELEKMSPEEICKLIEYTDEDAASDFAELERALCKECGQPLS